MNQSYCTHMLNLETTAALISVIVPVYRTERYLRECLDSIIRQTYGKLEIILVDDGSPDRCGAICDEYAARDGRIIVIHQENQGVSKARNAGLNIASGDYIMWVDSDDRIEPFSCECALKAAIEQRADLVCFGYRVIYESGKTREVVAPASGIQDKRRVMQELVWQRGNFRDSTWNKLFARELFDGTRFPEGKVYEDIGTLYKLLHKADMVYAIDKILYNYVIHSGSITSTGYQYRSHTDRLSFFEERLPFLQEHYPELVNLQLSMTLREMLIGMEEMKGDPLYDTYLEKVREFISVYKDRIQDFAHYTRVTWVYQHCRPLLPLFLKLRS